MCWYLLINFTFLFIKYEREQYNYIFIYLASVKVHDSRAQIAKIYSAYFVYCMSKTKRGCDAAAARCDTLVQIYA